MFDTTFVNSQTEATRSGDAGTNYSTGHLRRSYDFSQRLVKLLPSAHPYYTFVSNLGLKPTPDFQFKYSEERSTVRRRHGYVISQHAWDGSAALPTSGYTSFAVTESTGQPLSNTAGTGYYAVGVAGDIQYQGSFESIHGNSNKAINIGASDTRPRCFLVGQTVRIPLKTTKADKLGSDGSQDSGNTNAVADDYQICKIEDIGYSGDTTFLGLKVIKAATDSSAFFSSYIPTGTGANGYSMITAETTLEFYKKPEAFKEKFRMTVAGTAFAQGSGIPSSWADQPFSTGIGQTQIFKTVIDMENTIRATELKYVKNEWARIYGSKMMEHKDDIENAGLFSHMYTDGKTHYTQGIVDKVLDSGNVFDLNLSTKTVEMFMDDLNILIDPRTNSGKPTIFMADSVTYNWLVKASGLFSNSINSLGAAATNATFNAEFSLKETKSFFGIPTRIISTPSGDIKVVRNSHLDGTNIHMIGVDMTKVKYRPLVGNGLNRNTKLHVGVKTLENSGEDVRIDLIQTEAGFEITAPERHAIWKNA